MIFLGATAAQAEVPAPPRAQAAPVAEPAVSTSPTPTDPAPPSFERPNGPTGEPNRPLTRAATRQRIETMSPVGWLAHYGDVRVGRTR